MRIVDQGSGEELDDGGTDRFGQILSNGSRRRAGHDELVAILGHC